jgi:uncharacterized membrane protein SpoIIM required for sporulation
MKWAYRVRHKLKAAWVLTGIIIVILLSNLSERNSFSNLDNSMSSIYNDRLKPAAYIYDITNNLYQKRLLQDGNTAHQPQELKQLMQQHNADIALLMKKYETTYLTEEEKKQWLAFKTHLQEYNTIENQWLTLTLSDATAAMAMHDNIDKHFNLTLDNLNSLNKIQVGEGNNLQQHSRSIVNSTLIISYLEIALLIVLGLCTLVLLSVSDNTLFRQQHNQVLN